MLSIRLSLMMFLQYAVWGAWLPVLGKFLSTPVTQGGLGFSGAEIGTILGFAGSIGALSSPFIGQIADRHFSTERCLAILLLVGSVIKWLLASATSYESWFWLSIAYSVVFMPTLALTNSLAMAHLENRDQQFPRVRVWGTIGWIAVAWIFPMVWLQSSLQLTGLPPFLVGDDRPDVVARLADSMRLSAILSAGYAIYAFTLPHTPPRREGVEPLAIAKAFGLLRHRSFLVLALASVPITAIHTIYFIQTGSFLTSEGLADSKILPAMSIGQFSEIAVMAFLGLLLARVGYRWVIVLGALAYFARYFLWSMDLPLEIHVASQALHGICYSCFFAATYVYVDRLAPPDVRHSAQMVIGILVLGLGPILGGTLSGLLVERYTDPTNGLDFAALWRVLAWIGGGTAIFIALFFKDETQSGGVA